jgi:hypothetical protein
LVAGFVSLICMTLGRRRCFICDQDQQEQPVQLRLIINTPPGLKSSL